MTRLGADFSTTARSTVDGESEAYADWLDKYAAFTLMRVLAFGPGLSELADVDLETPHGEASKVIEKASFAVWS